LEAVRHPILNHTTVKRNATQERERLNQEYSERVAAVELVSIVISKLYPIDRKLQEHGQYVQQAITVCHSRLWDYTKLKRNIIQEHGRLNGEHAEKLAALEQVSRFKYSAILD
jgi:hypothetical protein